MKKNAYFLKKITKYFVNSKKSSTFAPAFEKEHVSLAQLVEQLTLNQWVESSSLSGDTSRAANCSAFFISSIFPTSIIL